MHRRQGGNKGPSLMMIIVETLPLLSLSSMIALYRGPSWSMEHLIFRTYISSHQVCLPANYQNVLEFKTFGSTMTHQAGTVRGILTVVYMFG